jgi:hypothetical protein
MITFQSIFLYLFFYDKLSGYPSYLIDVAWIGSSLLAAIFGVLFFIVNKETKVPTNTIISIALFGIIGFQFMLFKNWTIVLLLIFIAFSLHIHSHKGSAFTIFPVISSVMGFYSLGLYLLMTGITAM